MRTLAFSIILLTSVTTVVQAEEFGTLRGRFVYDGKAPVPEVFKGHVNESLVVDPKDGGIANVVVSLYLKKDEKPPMHPMLEKLHAKPTVMSLKDSRLEPHVVTILTGQMTEFENLDPDGFSLNLAVLKNIPNSETLPPHSAIKKVFRHSELMPVPVTCSIHPWVKGNLVILDHPYVAVTDAHGKFEIADIPAGDWTFRVWQEKSGYIKDVSVSGKATKWETGKFPVTMTKDGVDLGEVKVPAAAFKEK